MGFPDGERAEGDVMWDAEQVSITCETCHDRMLVPMKDIPSDAPLSMIAREFLERHRGCSISIQVQQQRR
jgi:hypothetical protein